MPYYSFQRFKDYHYAADPSYADIGLSAGIAVLFAGMCFTFTTISNIISNPVLVFALALIHQLLKRYCSGPNKDLKELGKNVCGMITAMGISPYLAFCAVCFIALRTSAVVIIMLLVIVAAVMVSVAARKATEHAKALTPVYTLGTMFPFLKIFYIRGIWISLSVVTAPTSGGSLATA